LWRWLFIIPFDSGLCFTRVMEVVTPIPQPPETSKAKETWTETTFPYTDVMIAGAGGIVGAGNNTIWRALMESPSPSPVLAISVRK
jgi:hypothetical protein